MFDFKNMSWQDKTYLLYFVSFCLWGGAMALLLVRFEQSGFYIEPYLTSTSTGIFLMLGALPGLTFFFFQSRRLRTASPDDAKRMFSRILAVQHLTGAPALAGGFILGLPFLINFFSWISAGFEAIWFSVGMMVPWIWLYTFIATYILLLIINRSRKAS